MDVRVLMGNGVFVGTCVFVGTSVRIDVAVTMGNGAGFAVATGTVITVPVAFGTAKDAAATAVLLDDAVWVAWVRDNDALPAGVSA